MFVSHIFNLSIAGVWSNADHRIADYRIHLPVTVGAAASRRVNLAATIEGIHGLANSGNSVGLRNSVVLVFRLAAWVVLALALGQGHQDPSLVHRLRKALRPQHLPKSRLRAARALCPARKLDFHRVLAHRVQAAQIPVRLRVVFSNLERLETPVSAAQLELRF